MTFYLALIGDLVHSRTHADRAGLQNKLQAVLKAINREYGDFIESKLTLTLGDEFQGLLKPDRRVMRLADDIETRIGHPLRLGFGYGTMLTAINPELSIGADGKAYWSARDAVTWLKEKGAEARIRIDGFGAWQDDLLNTILLTTDILKNGWTNLQDETFRALIQQGIYTDEFRQVDFARHLGIKPSSLTKRLLAGNIKTYIKARNTVGRTIEVWHHAR